jgi:hypothetical protein
VVDSFKKEGTMVHMAFLSESPSGPWVICTTTLAPCQISWNPTSWTQKLSRNFKVTLMVDGSSPHDDNVGKSIKSQDQGGLTTAPLSIVGTWYQGMTQCH